MELASKCNCKICLLINSSYGCGMIRVHRVPPYGVAIILWLAGMFMSYFCIPDFLHEFGHWLVVMLCGASVTVWKLWPPCEAYVSATFASKVGVVMFLVMGFMLTLIIFLVAVSALAYKRSRWAYLFISPLFSTVPSSQGDLSKLGIVIPEIIAFNVWLCGSIIILIVLLYYKVGFQRKMINFV